MIAPKHPKRAELAAEYPDEDLLFADGFDDAILGAVHVFTKEGRYLRVLYDYHEMVVILRRQMPDASLEDIVDYLETNTLGAYVGPSTPAYALLHDPFARRILAHRSPLRLG